MPTVCFTGRGVVSDGTVDGGTFYERANWERWTAAAGWNVLSHVDWGTTYLVASRTNTRKATDARTKGTQVITYNQYLVILQGLDQQAHDLPGRLLHRTPSIYTTPRSQRQEQQFTGVCQRCGTVRNIRPGYVLCNDCTPRVEDEPEPEAPFEPVLETPIVQPGAFFSRRRALNLDD